MPIEWSMEAVPLTDVERIEELLQRAWEPFVIYDGEIYFKKLLQVEAREPRSSTRSGS